MILRGVGAYPDDPYYDPGRPSWLPYWLDTPTESALKFGLYPGVTSVDPATLPKLPPPPGPGPYVPPEPGETQAQAQARSDARAYATWRQEYEAIMARAAAEEEDRKKKRDDPTLYYLGLAAAAGLGLVLLLRR